MADFVVIACGARPALHTAINAGHSKQIWTTDLRARSQRQQLRRDRGGAVGDITERLVMLGHSLEVHWVNEPSQLDVDELNDQVSDGDLDGVLVMRAPNPAAFHAWRRQQPRRLGPLGGEHNRIHDVWPTIAAEVDAGRWSWIEATKPRRPVIGARPVIGRRG